MKQSLRDKIRDCVQHCGEFLPQAVAYISFSDDADVVCGERACAFCRLALQDRDSVAFCRQFIRTAAYQALLTGEPGYFRCWAGLSSFLVPVAPRGELLGAVEFGGFFYVADAAGELAFARGSLRSLTPAAAARLEPRLHDVQTFSTTEARGFAEFVADALYSSGVNPVDEFGTRREKYLQQRRIAELLHTTADRSAADQDVFDLLAAMAAACRRGDREQLRLNLDGYFTRVLLLSGLNPDVFKAHQLQLLGLMLREHARRTALPFSAVLVRQQLLLQELEPLTDVADICHWVSLQVDRLAGFETEPGEGVLAAPLVQRVRRWIEVNYAQRSCSLKRVARETGASVPAIVRHLRQDTGRTFHAHLLERRLQEARALVSLSDLKLADIATRCGFSDQSHFTRHFTAAFNLSPRRYRRLGAAEV